MFPGGNVVEMVGWWNRVLKVVKLCRIRSEQRKWTSMPGGTHYIVRVKKIDMPTLSTLLCSLLIFIVLYRKVTLKLWFMVPMTNGTDWTRLISSCARIISRFRFFISSLMYSSWPCQVVYRAHWELETSLTKCYGLLAPATIRLHWIHHI